MLYPTWTCAVDKELVSPDMPAAVPVAIKRRIVIGQSLYAFGALLCLIDTYWSIAFIVLVQLNYAIAPHPPPHGWLRRDRCASARSSPTNGVEQVSRLIPAASIRIRPDCCQEVVWSAVRNPSSSTGLRRRHPAHPPRPSSRLPQSCLQLSLNRGSPPVGRLRAPRHVPP